MFDLQKFQQNIACYDENEHYIKYGDIIMVAEEITTVIGSRNLIFLLCDNSMSSLVYYVALLYTDNVVQVVSLENKEDWIQKYQYDFQPDYICKPRGQGDCLSVVHQFMDYCLLWGENSFFFDIHPDLALLIPSSGSTGECKFIRQSKANILANTDAIIDCLEISQTDKPILSLPMSYTYGLSIINTHISVGATLLITKKKIVQKEFWDFFNRQKGTSFSGVPYSYELLNRFGFVDLELPFLNCMTQAGGKLSNDLIQKYNNYARENNVRFYVMYGQTEATARMSCLPYQYAWKNEKVGSVGIAISGTNLYLVDDTGEKITQSNREGEIIFVGKNVTLGYAESYHDLCKGDANHGILKTGDIAYVDGDGFIFITGRKKRFVKICGKRINLDVIENYLLERYGNQIDCAVVGNDIKIFVAIDQKEMRAKLESELLNYFRLHKFNLGVYYWKYIPKTLSGKKDYEKIMKKYC